MDATVSSRGLKVEGNLRDKQVETDCPNSPTRDGSSKLHEKKKEKKNKLRIGMKHIQTSIQKQTKNRNETGSNLSLGTRLTVLSKRLGRKRCCDTTPDRCLKCNRLTILTSHC